MDPDCAVNSDLISMAVAAETPGEVQPGLAIDRGLEVFVVYTEPHATLAALQAAGRLGQRIEPRIHLLVPFEVPYALPLDRPQVPVGFLEGRIRDLIGKARVEATAQICLCRDKMRALAFLLKPHSVVVVGGRRSWRPTGARKLLRILQKAGHRVLFAESK